MKWLTVLFICFSWCCLQVRGAIIRVPQDYPTIQSAINAADNTDTVLVSAGVYRENINFSGKAIEVLAESGSTHTVIDGQNNGSVVTFNSGEEADSVLKQFTIRYGVGSGSPSYKGGGLTCIGSSPLITENVIWSNTAVRGGGMYLCDSSAEISHCVIVDNSAEFDGGAIYARTSTGPSVSPTIFNCLITGNEADYGAGLFCYAADPQVVNCTFDFNNGTQFAGGIYCMAESHAQIRNTLITNSVNGHGIYSLDSGSAPTVEYSDVWNNPAGNYGGGAFAGTGCISGNPLYIVGYLGQHYLSQIAAGQTQNSPCWNAGGDQAAVLGLDVYTTRTDHGLDIELVDMGYHYKPVALPSATPTGSPTPTWTPTYPPPTATPAPPTNTPTPTAPPRVLRVPHDYPFIQTAINAALDGDVVLVSSGIYHEHINFLGKEITVRSESGANKTLIDGSDNGTVVTFNSGETDKSILRGFTVQSGLGSSGSQLWGGGIQITGGSSPVVEGCTIRQNSSPKGAAILISGWGSNPVIRFSEVLNNDALNGDGGGIYITQDAEPYIFSNLIAGNTANYGGGVFATQCNPRIVNNTITENAGDSFGGGLYYLNATGEIISNIICSQISGQGIYVYEDNEIPVLYHNDIWNNPGGNYGGAVQWGTGDIHVDPIFVTGPNGGYYLSNVQAGQSEHSMCIDNGYYDADEIGLDEYTTRVDHREDMYKSDIGFHYGFEGMYTPTPTPTPCIYDSRLALNQEIFYPGDTFYLYLRLLNTCGEMIYVDQVIMLDVYGQYWFWPGWTEDFDYQPVKMPTYIEVLPIFDFTWPSVEATLFDLRFWWAAFETDHMDMDHLVGEIGFVEWGFASPH